MTSWPSGAVVKVLAYHAGGREFESPLEQFFFFFFFEKRFFFYPLFTFKPLFFFALVYFSFSYLHNLDFFFFFFFFPNRSTCNFLFQTYTNLIIY